MSSSTSKTFSRSKKNAPGARLDLSWKYGTEVDAKTRKVRCNFCGNIRSGGIYRLKHHLACTHQNVDACVQVPDNVRKEMVELLEASAEQAMSKKKRYIDSSHDSVEASEMEGVEGPMNRFLDKKKGISIDRQTTLNEKWKKHDRDKVCDSIARWFYTNAIPFNAANNSFFSEMIKDVSEFGKGLKAPSYHELREPLLKKQVQQAKILIETHKEQWKKTGCTIMSDGWTDQRKRTMNNFLVNSPAGTVFLYSVDTTDICKTAEKIFHLLDDVVEEVGEEHVVQVVTDNASNYKAAGRLLMQKRKHLFWTPCAAHCLDLVLEDFEKHDPIHKKTIARAKSVVSYIYSWGTVVNWMKEFTKGKELLRPGATRFATSYLTLGRLNELKGELLNFFSSEQWRESAYAKKKKGVQICDIIFDTQTFWPNVQLCMNIALPLIKVLRMVDSDDVPSMGFLHKAIDNAKEEIKTKLKNVKKR